MQKTFMIVCGAPAALAATGESPDINNSQNVSDRLTAYKKRSLLSASFAQVLNKTKMEKVKDEHTDIADLFLGDVDKEYEPKFKPGDAKPEARSQKPIVSTESNESPQDSFSDGNEQQPADLHEVEFEFEFESQQQPSESLHEEVKVNKSDTVDLDYKMQELKKQQQQADEKMMKLQQAKWRQQQKVLKKSKAITSTNLLRKDKQDQYRMDSDDESSNLPVGSNDYKGQQQTASHESKSASPNSSFDDQEQMRSVNPDQIDFKIEIQPLPSGKTEEEELLARFNKRQIQKAIRQNYR